MRTNFSSYIYEDFLKQVRFYSEFVSTGSNWSNWLKAGPAEIPISIDLNKDDNAVNADGESPTTYDQTKGEHPESESQSQSNMDYFANTTPGQDMSMESSTKVSNDVASWKNLSASERESIVQALEIINLIYKKKLECLYPQICICLRIFLSIPVSEASGERLFSMLALIKNRLRSTMSQERLNSLMLLSTEHKLTRTLNFEELIDKFAKEKARKIRF